MTVEIILYLASGMGVALIALAIWAWNHTHKRIDEKVDKSYADMLAEALKIANERIEQEVRCARIKFDGKADETEMIRQRVHIENLFEGQEKIRAEMNSGFTKVTEKMNASHLVLLDKLSEIARK